MTKRHILMAAMGAAVGFVVARCFKPPSPVVMEAPEISPELQMWMQYVEKYPNLEDDPRVKRAIDLLDSLDDPK